MMKRFCISSFVAFTIVCTTSALPQSAPKATKEAKTLDQLAPDIKAAKTVDVKPLIKSSAKRQLLQFGPFELKAATQDMPGGHAHEAPSGSDGGIMSGGASGAAMLDPMMFFRGGAPLAIADFLANTMDPEGFNFMHQVKRGLCQDCTVLGAKIDMIFENGTRADVSSGVYLHHIIALNVAERKLDNDLLDSPLPFCSGSDWAMSLASGAGSVMSLFGQNTHAGVFGFGAVDEFKQLYTTPDGSFNSGFHLASGDKLLFQGEVVNYRPEPQRLYLQFDVEYLPGKVGRNAATVFTTVSACNEPMTFKGNGGAGRYVGKDLKISQDGTIIAARGHMHDGGEGMKVTLNGKTICNSKAEYGTSYSRNTTAQKWTTINKMTGCHEAIPVKKGNVITLEADYDTIKHPLRESSGQQQTQMGLVAFTFVQDR